MTLQFDIIEERLRHRIRSVADVERRGILKSAQGLTLRAQLHDARIGDLCKLQNPDGEAVLAEIIGVSGDEAVMTAYADIKGISNITQVVSLKKPPFIRVGRHLLGQAIDAFGRGLTETADRDATVAPLHRPAPPALSRQLISELFVTGVRAIDAGLTMGRGQRAGIFGSAGLGKSTLVSMLVNRAEADVIVVGLVGERGREVREFWERHISSSVREKAVLVFATSDAPPIERRTAAFTAMSVAESFRDQGRNVLLVVDSLTRLARAQRDVALAAGEPPVRRGFPPSVATFLAEFVERAGPSAHGTITGFFTVLVEGPIEDDPIAEEVRSLLDGHIVLTSKLFERGIVPAIDLVSSRSRLMQAVAKPEHIRAADTLRRMLARLQEVELLLDIGEYKPGQDQFTDDVIARRADIDAFRRQGIDEIVSFDDTVSLLSELVADRGAHEP